MGSGTPRLCIIADDLTGALDAAASFAARGLVTDVVLEPDLAGEIASSPDSMVIAVSTRSREIDPQSAARLVAGVAAQLPPGTRIFKKVDSRMKGNVAAELAALDPARILVVPAIPEFGRIVRDGCVRGFGVEDPLPIAPRLGHLAARAIIPDTATDEDIHAAMTLAGDALMVGARGLSEAMAPQLAYALLGRDQLTHPRPKGRRALFVIGSRDPITVAQVDALRDSVEADWRGAPNGIAAPLPVSRPLTVVQALPGDGDVGGDQVARALAHSIHPLLTADCDVLFLSGGATAEVVLLEMGLTRLRLLGECLPGLPVSTAGGRTIITKSGGFGQRSTLVELAGMIAEGA